MRPKRTGLSRLWRYTEGRRRRLSVVLALAAVSAAAPVAMWHIVGDAIDNGIVARDSGRLAEDVVAYVSIGAVAWLLGTATWLMLAAHRPADGARAAPRPVRAPHLAVAALLLGAEGRLDHRAPDERRGRPLRRPQPGADDARRQHADLDRSDRRPLPARLASRPRGAARAAARNRRHALVPAALARGVLRRPYANRRRHGAARRVRRRNGGRAGVQPRARVPARVRGAERGEPRLEHRTPRSSRPSSSRPSSSSASSPRWR